MPFLAPANDIVLAADTVLIVEGSRLDMAVDHEVEERVGRLLRVIDVHVIASKSQLICGDIASRQKLVLKQFVSELEFFFLLL